MAIMKLENGKVNLHGRAGGMVFYTVCGTTYVRSYIIPRNPKTPGQQKHRSSFAHAVKLWQHLSGREKSCYNRLAEGTRLSGYNFFISMTLNNKIHLPGYAVLSELIRKSSAIDPYFLRPSSVPLRQTSDHYKNRDRKDRNKVIILKKPPGELAMAS